MARPNKKGLDYFPFDVDFFSDEKIGSISGEFGIKGEITAIKLLCAIYRNGYFILWNDALKMSLLRGLPGISLELLEQIVARLVRWGFFEQSLFSTVRVLTSKGIQERYFEAIKRRKDLSDYPFLLVNVDNKGVNVDNNGVNVNNNRQSKVKERKEKKIAKKEFSSEQSNGGNNKFVQTISKIEEEFERFRKAYPGNKRGSKIEFDNFKKKHSDYRTAVFLLYPALEKLNEWREQKRRLNQFVPEYANLSTWLNQRRWEMEFEKIEKNETTETKRYDNGDFLR